MVHREAREDAIASMGSTLASTVLNGPPTNLELLQEIMKAPGEYTAQSIDAHP